MLEAVISDLGNVVYPERWDLVERELNSSLSYAISIEKFREYFDKVWPDYSVGADQRSIWGYIIYNLGQELTKENIGKASKAFKHIWYESDEEIVKIFSKLKRKNHLKFFALSNSCVENEERIRDNAVIFYLFDKIYFSHRTGVRKPHERAYHNILEENNLEPQNCVYIDDMKRNIEPANLLRMKTILYQNPKQLAEDLESILQLKEIEA